MTALAARRRHPLAASCCVLLGLVVTGVAVRGARPGPAERRRRPRAEDDRQRASKLFLANCATCHGLDAAGPQRRARASSASAPPPSTSRSAPAGCRCSRAGPQAPRQAGPVHRGADPPARRLRRSPRPRAGRSRRGRRSTRPRVTPSRGGADLPHQLRDVPQLRRQGRRADPRQVRAEPRRRDRPRTSTRPWSPARSRCRSSTTRRSPRRTSGTSSPTSRRREEQPSPGGFSLGFIGPVNEGLVGLGRRARRADRLRRLARVEVVVSDRVNVPTTTRSTGMSGHTPAPHDAPARGRPGATAATPCRSGSRTPACPRTGTGWPTSTRRRPSAPSARSPRCSASARSARCCPGGLLRGQVRHPDVVHGAPEPAAAQHDRCSASGCSSPCSASAPAPSTGPRRSCRTRSGSRTGTCMRGIGRRTATTPSRSSRRARRSPASAAGR